jgi:geranylgeranyl diphosphate synthase type I
VLAAVHTERIWRGDADSFGVSAAIVAGDLCLVWADELVRHSGLPAASLERGWPIYDAMRAQTIHGQYLDLVAQASGGYDATQAWQVAESKTAASTTTGPLLFGAALAGASGELQAALAEYGHALGIAFQLRDDLLGAFGDPHLTGKPSGDDLRDGKATLLVAEARRRAGEEGSLVIEEMLERGEVAELRALLENTGARASVERLIERLTAEALGVIDSAPVVDETARVVLRGLALALTR